MTIIEKDLIIKAKKKLGEQQALYIAQNMPLSEFNESFLKAICPFHDENTPSFIWNKSDHYFKCFGCGKVFDIIDYFIYKGCSFIEACNYLFKFAKIEYQYDTPELKKDYRYPKIETYTKRNTVDQYLNMRKISKETLDFAGIKQDKKGNIVFEYYNLDKVLLTVKYRPARKIEKGELKTWCQSKADTSPILYGMHQIDTSKPLLITEGEIDRLACIEAGYNNVVSVPFGANSYSWIEYNWDWLEQFDKIIIWSDNDEPGKKMTETVIPRLGTWRCYEAKGTEKDINLELFKYGKEHVLKVIEEAREVPIRDIVDLADIEDYDITKAEGLSSNLKGLDKWLSKYYFGTVNLVVGINGSGKSTLVNQIFIAESLEQGYKTFIFSGELTKPLLRSWIEFPLAGKKHIDVIDRGKNQPKGYRVKSKIKEKMRDWYRNKVFIYDKDFNILANELLEKIDELARKYGVKNFILDNLMMINCSEYNKYNDYEAQCTFVLKLCEIARNYNILIHLLHHPSKLDSIRKLTKMDVAGMAKITNLVHYVTAIHRVSESEKEGVLKKNGEYMVEPLKYDALIDILKNRLTGYQDKTVGMYFDMASKRYYGDSDNVNKNYNWDTTEEIKEEILTVIEGDVDELPY
jgi:twinkle protein